VLYKGRRRIKAKLDGGLSLSSSGMGAGKWVLEERIKLDQEGNITGVRESKKSETRVGEEPKREKARGLL